MNCMCDQCGIEHRRSPSHFNHKNFFCSNACHSDFMRGRPLKEFLVIKKHKNPYVLIVERGLGKPIPSGSMVHHIDLNRKNDSNANLVLCQDDQYHKILHKRTRILMNGGNPNTDQLCGTCHKIKNRIEFDPSDRIRSGRCKVCKRDYTKERRRNGSR